MPSSTRTAALGKYLASLAKHFPDTKKDPGSRTETCNPSASRKRLNIFYLLNDLLHHAKYHSQNASLFSTFSDSLRPFLADLIQATASDCKAKVRTRMLEVLGLWKTDEYYAADYIFRLKEVLETTEGSNSSKALSTELKILEPDADVKELPFIMPSTHGDPSVPYYDLPAGNLMPHIMPNSSVAIRPDQVRALQFAPGPADDDLVHALKDFLKEVGKITDSAKSDELAIIADVDDLGQVFYQDENGALFGGDTYYGWSRSFCEKMKRRREGESSRERRTRSYSSSRSPSRSRSRGPRKRRRYSDSINSRSTSRSGSDQSRGSWHGQQEELFTRHAFRAYRKQSRSRSRSPEQPDPLGVPPLPQTSSYPREGFPSQFPAPSIARTHPPPFHMLPNQITFQAPLGPGGIPLPPPPPPNYSGPWPPKMNFPPGLPFPVLSTQQGNSFTPRSGPPGPSQNWYSGKRQGNS